MNVELVRNIRHLLPQLISFLFPHCELLFGELYLLQAKQQFSIKGLDHITIPIQAFHFSQHEPADLCCRPTKRGITIQTHITDDPQEYFVSHLFKLLGQLFLFSKLLQPAETNIGIVRVGRQSVNKKRDVTVVVGVEGVENGGEDLGHQLEALLALHLMFAWVDI